MSDVDARAACEKMMAGKKADAVEDIKTEETKVDAEVKSEKAEEPKAEPEVKEVAEGKPVVSAEETPKEDEKEVVAEKPADIQEAETVATLLKQTIAKIDQLLEKKEVVVKADETALADGAASIEAAPKDGDSKTPVEEGKGEDVSPEGAEASEALGKVNDELGKVADKMLKVEDLMQKVSTDIKTVADRVTKLEEQPVPSKVYSAAVISKSGMVNQDSNVNERLAQVQKELKDLETLKTTNLAVFQQQRGWEKAVTLIDERNALLLKTE